MRDPQWPSAVSTYPRGLWSKESGFEDSVGVDLTESRARKYVRKKNGLPEDAGEPVAFAEAEKKPLRPGG